MFQQNQIIEGRYQLNKKECNETFGEVWEAKDIKHPESPVSIVISDMLFADRYRLTIQIGAGGFGEVWKAYDTEANCYVAIKIYKDFNNVHAANDFRREYDRVRMIRHDNLLTASHVGAAEGKIPYLEMELCRGSLVDKAGQMSESEIWKVVHDVASGLYRLTINKRAVGDGEAKPDPIVHQDIKPANILIRQNGSYALADFGISKRKLASMTHTDNKVSESSGTQGYKAPEKYRGKSLLSSDIWSFGATLFELVTGELPFLDVAGHPQNQGEEVPEIDAEVSDQLKNLIRDCMAVNPIDRPTAEELMDYSAAVIAGENPKKSWTGIGVIKDSGPKSVTRRETKNKSKNKPKEKPIEKNAEIGKLLKNVVFLLLALLAVAAVCLLVVRAYGNTDQEWRKAKRTNTAESYIAYVNSHPDGEETAKALSNLLSLAPAEQNQVGLDYLAKLFKTGELNNYSEVSVAFKDTLIAFDGRIRTQMDSLAATRMVRSFRNMLDSAIYDNLEICIERAMLFDSLTERVHEIKSVIEGKDSRDISDGLNDKIYNQIVEIHRVLLNDMELTTDEYKPIYQERLNLINYYLISKKSFGFVEETLQETSTVDESNNDKKKPGVKVHVGTEDGINHMADKKTYLDTNVIKTGSTQYI